MKISRAAAYAAYGLRYLADRGLHQRTPINEIAKSFKLPEKHLAKIFQDLAKTRLVDSVRGIHGGFMLALPPEQISLLDIVEAVEGPFNTDDCFFRFGACTFDRECRLCDQLRAGQESLMDVLRGIKVSDLMQGEEPAAHWPDNPETADQELNPLKEGAGAIVY